MDREGHGFARAGCRADGVLGLGHRSMVVNLHNQTAVVEGHAALGEVVEHVVRDRPGPEVFEKELHGGVVRKGAFLLVEAEVFRVKVDDQGRRVPGELPENVGTSNHCVSVLAIAWSVRVAMW